MLRVLIVDDDRDTAAPLAIVLRRWGYEVRAALDGPAALHEAETFRPGAVILDLAMPRMNGFKVARRLREMFPAGPTVICLSGYGTAADRERAREAGCDYHVIKPGEPDELRQLLGPPD
jgi:DNA-binding response OmpR family regulator